MSDEKFRLSDSNDEDWFENNNAVDSKSSDSEHGDDNEDIEVDVEGPECRGNSA